MAKRVLLKSTSTAPWHPGYPFRKEGILRKAVSGVTLAALVTIIGGYMYVTDSRRVKGLAEKYLSEVVGGPVRVGRARLSIFEGLRLDNVTVAVDRLSAPDSRLLQAQSLHVSFSIPELLKGNFSSVTILAVEPQVLLVSDATGGNWNFQRLRASAATTRTTTPTDFSNLSLPQVVLRNAKVTYAELRDGKLVPRSTVAVEGNLTPDGSDRYSFAISARGPSEGAGPSLTGWAQLSTGQLSASLRDFSLGADFGGMLPAPVRDWWQRHEVAGNVEIPELSVEPGTKEKPFSFRVVTRFADGAVSIRPEELRLPSAPAVPTGLPAIRFSNVRGELLFTEGGIELQKMSLVHEGNVLKVGGSLSGYAPSAPFAINVACDRLLLSEHPSFVPSLPPEAREVYDRFSPSGEGSFQFAISRGTDGKLATNGRLDITKGQMTFDKFPFTCHDITGAIVVTAVEPGKTKLEIVDIRGHGKKEGGNFKADMRVNGEMFPLEGGSKIDVDIRGNNVTADDELVAAMPEGVRQALHMFAGPGRKYPEFGGSFTAEIHRDLGRVANWRWPIDVNLAWGKGRFEPFPYPLDNIAGQVLIRSGYVQLEDVRTTRHGKNGGGDALLMVDGRVTYKDQPEGKLLYDLAIDAKRVPLDQTLIESVPADKREWLTTLGLTGMLDVTGQVKGIDGRYELGLALSDGQMKPNGGPWVASDLRGDLLLTTTSLTIKSVDGKRGDAALHADGLVKWETGKPEVQLKATASRLPLDAELREVLPTDAKAGWDAVKPEGSADVTVAVDQTKKPGSTSGMAGATVIDISPLGATVVPAVLPVKISDVRGAIRIADGRVTISDMTATRNGSAIALSGSGATGERQPWEFAITAKDAVVDDELRAALPGMLKETFTALDMAGRADVQVRRLSFRPGAGGFGPAPIAPAAAGAVAAIDGVALPPTSRPKGAGMGSDADFDVVVFPRDVNFKLGVPVHATAGTVDFKGSIRDDRLGNLTGNILLSTGEIAERPYTNFRTTITKSESQPGIRLDAISAKLADGDVAGRAAVAFPDGEPIRYAMDLALRNADVHQLLGPKGEAVSGRLSASLALEGTVDDAGSRKGRGDISVTGDRMARIPILLGLVQVANLSLPGNTSFNNATAKYSLNGPHVMFDQLAIRSPGLEMMGNGRIDLDQRDVRLTLWTAPPDMPRVPVWSDLTDPIRRELLQIQVRGTIDNPRIGASSFDSFTTTVEEVLQSGRGTGVPNKPPAGSKKK